jgi:hypothetical protein
MYMQDQGVPWCSTKQREDCKCDVVRLIKLLFVACCPSGAHSAPNEQAAASPIGDPCTLHATIVRLASLLRNFYDRPED